MLYECVIKMELLVISAQLHCGSFEKYPTLGLGLNSVCSCLLLQRFCADVVSVLAMTMSGERECLKYRLVGSQEELASWGHEYVR